MYTDMYTKETVMPDTISDTRSDLTKHVHRFRAEGMEAEPVVFGDHRKAEAVLLPHSLFEFLLEVAEDFAIAQQIRERDARDNGNRTSLREVAERFDVDLDSLV